VTELCSDCSVEEINEKRDAGEDLFLLDVRTAQELDIAKLDFADHIPMDEIQARIGELESRRDQEIIVMCHHGGRSAHVQGFLINAGFKNVRNLVGGIDVYASRIDTSLSRY